MVVPKQFSRAQEGFWQHLVRQLDGCAAALLTADHLLARHRRHGGRVYGSQATMAVELRVSERTIRRHLKRLENAGLVTVIRCAPERDPGSGRWFRRLSNAYLLRFPSKSQALNRREARRRRCGEVPPSDVSGQELMSEPVESVSVAGERGRGGLPALVIPPEWSSPPNRDAAAAEASLSFTYRTPESSHDPSGSTSTGATIGAASLVVENVDVPRETPEGSDAVSVREAFAVMRARLRPGMRS